MLSWRTRPATVVVEHAFEFFPLKDASGRELPACSRAWLVPLADGWVVRQVAATAAAEPPRDNYLASGGGKNCARWVLEVAAVAGIDAHNWFSSVVAVPKRLFRPHGPVSEEGRMWQSRQADRANRHT